MFLNVQLKPHDVRKIVWSQNMILHNKMSCNAPYIKQHYG